MDCIQSAHNPLFKEVRKLVENRRERLKTGLALLDGAHLLTAWLDAGKPVEKILLTEAGRASPEIAAQLVRTPAPQVVFDPRLFTELTELPSPSGVLALVRQPQPEKLRRDGFCLLLDGVQDPGNVGTMLRTAAAAGVDQVLLSPGCADIWSPKTLRAGMGAQAVLDMVERADLQAFIDGFEGRVLAMTLDGASDLFATPLTGNLAMLFGSEGAGVSPELTARANLRVKIPMAPGIESLNVATAAAICLYERVRQSVPAIG